MTTASIPFAFVADAGIPDVPAWDLSGKFRAYDLSILDPEVVRSDLEDGAGTLALMGTVYDLAVAPAPWSQPAALARPGAEGSHVILETLEVAAFVGSIVGAPASDVLVTVTPQGVAGHLMTETVSLYFEPAAFIRPDAPTFLTVAYKASDVILPKDVTEEVAEAPPMPGGVPPLGVQEEDHDEESHSPGPNRAMTVWGDKAMRDIYTTNTASKMTSVWNELNSAFSTAAGFSFTLVDNTFYVCDTTTCDSDWGMTSTDAATLRTTWAGKLDTLDPVSYEIAHLFTGKNLDGTTIGISYIPGRYAISQIRDETGTYDGGSSNYEAGILVAHEVGHDFNGRHPRATSYSHDHGFNHVHTVCDLSIAGVCLQSHTENHWHADVYTHYTIMWTPFSHEPGSKQEQPHEFSGGGTSGNYHWIRSCNDLSWGTGTYTPGSATGFGSHCTTA